jgi:retron-type reverse transcriptase
MSGLDRSIVEGIDESLTLKRIESDIRTDFILAPHYNAIFTRAGEELWDFVRTSLRSGKYEPELPLTVNVPKGRGFSRPGSILQPVDRFVYQALIDLSAEQLEELIDRKRSFSHVLSPDEGAMFEPAQECWDTLQASVYEMASEEGYILKADIANYFERLPQHHLINLMDASGIETGVVKLLEDMLSAFQERDSFGIIQGTYPSDLLGNFYLTELDSYCELQDIPSARYVDDFYLHFADLYEAKNGLVELQEHLRKEGLHLNEFKSRIHQASQLIYEETIVDNLFEAAKDEVREDWFSYQAGYGFSAEWYDDEPEPDEEEIELNALHNLYGAKGDYEAHSDKIEKFCLPIFRAAHDEIAIEESLEGVIERPHLTKLYQSYLSRFVRSHDDLRDELCSLVERKEMYTDYQRMYLFGALLNADSVPRAIAKTAVKYLKDTSRSIELRAICAIFASKYGAPQQRRAVRLAYEDEPSPYVRAAIMYSTRYFTGAERRTCIKAWSNHSMENLWIVKAIKAV